MNDYLLERYSKNDIRELWSLFLVQKKEWTHQLAALTDEKQENILEGKLSSITYCMTEIEKRFDLF